MTDAAMSGRRYFQSKDFTILAPYFIKLNPTYIEEKFARIILIASPRLQES